MTLVPAVPSAQAAGPDTMDFVVGYSIKEISDVDPKDIEAALKVWSKELGNAYHFRVEANLYDNVDKLVADFNESKLNFMIMNSIDYFRRAKILKVKPEASPYRNGKPTMKYVVLAGTIRHLAEIGILKNKKLSIAKNNHLGQIYLDTLLMRSKLSSSDRFFAGIDEKSKESQAILDVFFGKSGACVVSETAFQTMKELNPQVGSKLHVLAESPEFIYTVGIFHPSYPPDYKKKAFIGIGTDYKHHERGKQIILLFNIDRMDRITDGQLETVRQLVSEHDRLKKRQ